MSRTVAALAAALTLLSACSGDDGEGVTAATEPPVTASTSPPTDPPPPTSTTSAPATSDPATSPAPSTTAAPSFTSAIYADAASWICRPDLDDVCDEPYPITDVASDGSLSERPYEVDPDPAADCFYAYPTTSDDPTPRSDLDPVAEVETVRLQAARFSQVCAVYAPVYRQVTVAGLFGGSSPDDWNAAYADVLEAWRHYLANDNRGRPVVLIGHSQGSGHLTRLLAEEIEPDTTQRDLLVSAMLIGTNFAVPEGADVGITTQQIPLCRANTQTGCVVTYATYPSGSPPPPTAFFGRPRGFPLGSAEGVSGCTNPAALAGGAAPLDPAFPTAPWALGSAADDDGIATPFMSFPGLLTGECVTRDGFTYLEVTVAVDPADPRVDDVPGRLTPDWGWHAIDVQLAQESLIELAGQQIAAATQG